MKTDNELIAEFMGYTCDNNHGWYEGPRINNEVTSAIGKGVFALNIDSAMFHESWDWLMPVVEKIATIHRIDFSIKAYIGSGGIQVFDALADTQKSETISFIQEEEVGSLLSVTYKAVVEFIKWFNQQSNG